jgi:hypothetical protein
VFIQGGRDAFHHVTGHATIDGVGKLDETRLPF